MKKEKFFQEERADEVADDNTWGLYLEFFFFLFLLGANVEGMRTGRVDNRNMRNNSKRIKN